MALLIAWIQGFEQTILIQGTIPFDPSLSLCRSRFSLAPLCPGQRAQCSQGCQPLPAHLHGTGCLPLSLSFTLNQEAAWFQRLKAHPARREALGVLRIRLDCSFTLLEKTHHLPIHGKTGPEIHQAHDLLLNRCFRPSGKPGSCEEPACICGGVCTPEHSCPLRPDPVSFLCFPHLSPGSSSGGLSNPPLA